MANSSRAVHQGALNQSKSFFSKQWGVTAILVFAVTTTNRLIAAEPDPRVQNESSAAANQNSNVRKIKVTVVSAAGQPIEGADVLVVRGPYDAIDPVPERMATSDAAGLAEFDVMEYPNGFVVGQTVETFLIKANGHGSVLLSSHELLNPQNATLLGRLFSGTSPQKIVLPRAPRPYRGRLISIDGQPLQNVRLSFRRLESMNQGAAARAADPNATPEQLTERVRRVIDQLIGLRYRQLLPMTTSDASGWFEISFPENEIAELLAERDDLESTALLVRNAEAAEVAIPQRSTHSDLHRTLRQNGAKFVMAASAPVTGRVQSAETGEPIAGAVVAVCEIPGINYLTYWGREHFQTRTDTEGRYRITGLPLGKGLRITTWSTGETPYVTVGAKLGTKLGEPVEQDLKMPLGIWADIHVLDGDTRESLNGRLEYNIFDEDDVRKKFPGIGDAYVQHGYELDADGRIRVAVLPARAILAFSYQPVPRAGMQDDHFRYARGGGMEAIGGMKKDGMEMFQTLPHYVSPINYTQLLEINPPAGSAPLKIDLEVRAATPILVNVVDDQQRAVSGLRHYADMIGGWIAEPSGQLRVKGIQPGETRRVFVYSPDQNLAGAVRVTQRAKEPYSLALQSAGRLRGRLVDEAGEPIPGIQFFPDYDRYNKDAEAGMWEGGKSVVDPRTGRFHTDKDGRFEVVGLVPGWKYTAWMQDPSGQKKNFITDHLFENIVVKPGETIDVGDVAVDERGKRKPK